MIFEKFDNYMLNSISNKDNLIRLIKDDILNTINNNYDFTLSLFNRRSKGLKFLLQSHQDIFWEFNDFFDELQYKDYTQNDSIDELKENGLIVIKNFIPKELLHNLQNDWNAHLAQDIHITPQIQSSIDKNKFAFLSYLDKDIAIGSDLEAKKRVIFREYNKNIPQFIRDTFFDNDMFNNTVNQYYNIKNANPKAVMYEKLTTPKFFRNDEYWHIDNLSDQFKIFLILEDMKENDGPFTYIPKTHKLQDRYKDRYHKMYTMNGLTTQEHNHFEASFTNTEDKISAVLNAGDAVFFDTKIHHTATFPYDNGSRKNIVLYYDHVPTYKNQFLFRLDNFYNFGLR